MREKLVLSFIIFILAFGSLSTTVANVSINNTTTDKTIQAQVTFANYTDIDDDTYQDDVYATVEVDLNGGKTYNFEYYITLILPSGTSYSYFYLITTNYEDLTITNLFYDHATENGWYQIDIEVVLQNGGRSTDDHSYEFDPPGGSSGGDPDLDIVAS